LYGDVWDEAILTRRVGEVRRGLGLDGEDVRPNGEDRAAFAFWGGVSVLTYLATGAFMFAPALALLGVLWLWLAR
ncbi:MAG: hypothetical protein ABW208_01830, partial [Pyrinomonadaceae bacterium]